jgi:hypothetical protein
MSGMNMELTNPEKNSQPLSVNLQSFSEIEKRCDWALQKIILPEAPAAACHPIVSGLSFSVNRTDTKLTPCLPKVFLS